MTQDNPENHEIVLDAEPVISAAAERLGFKPLYRQVKDHFLKRMIDGGWPPGFGLPSEGQLALELGVSQGTVRKALDEMSTENLLVRRQGRGTFVAQHDEKRILFQFFKLVTDGGEARFPESRLIHARNAKGSLDECAMLGLAPGAEACRIRRLRLLDGKPIIIEDISLPSTLFPGLAMAEIPNNLYALYAMRHGITIASAREKLKAVALDSSDASELGVMAGHPALLVDRLALSVSGAAVEWRRSLCLTESLHYLSELK